MTHARMAPVMGLGMGAMIPLMVHGPAAGAGLGFVLAHVAALAAALGLAAVFPVVRAWLGRHRPSRAMLGRMGLGAVAGFALVCVHCLVTWHGSV